MPATPIDVLLVASLRINGQRSEPRRLIRSLQPTVGKNHMNVLPSSKRLQFLRKVQSLRHSKYIHILVRPNFPVTGDGDSLADCEDAKIFDWLKGAQVILDTRIILKDLHPSLVHDNVRGLMNF
jgi:hypothetical protein